ncbi:hypothetical protein GCM10009125_16620 [Castellaniella daejeonensis]|uniref:Uncharacterized protein n=1 Tax=Castellaniella daejeonensis TaxID=659013 RepID=A0ABN0TRD6_9BURK
MIWSCEADNPPAMCGRATLAMVLSSVCMMVASMIDAVIMGRAAWSASGRRDFESVVIGEVDVITWVTTFAKKGVCRLVFLGRRLFEIGQQLAQQALQLIHFFRGEAIERLLEVPSP